MVGIDFVIYIFFANVGNKFTTSKKNYENISSARNVDVDVSVSVIDNARPLLRKACFHTLDKVFYAFL